MAFLSHSITQGPIRRSIGLFTVFKLARSRQRLSELDDAQLRDIGLTREEANIESRRPVWDVPHNWLR